MEIAIGLLAIAATVLGGSWLADRFDLPAPIVLIVIGFLVGPGGVSIFNV